MTKLCDPFEEKVQHLIDNGWMARTPMSFVKYGIEIFFDNSTAVEIYPSNESDRRLDDLQICTIADLAGLVNDIKNGKYQS
ncbi:MAG: hypothetical protein KKH12_01955 [Gammaproteobacteria bacterium]|nr:hypothetical protein [Gammaproteobacteria bacterium]MBU1480418.1 hypothetical protein [Gammaproteobacteria bacterium]